MEQVNNQIFGLLPATLVEELLGQSDSVGDKLIKNLHEIKENRHLYRQQLIDSKLLRKFSDLPDAGIQTTCGIDGSYVVERLMATDLVACAAVAIEGLTPPIEKRYWDSIRHDLFIDAVTHNPDTTVIVQGITWEMEICLAAKAPHDVVFIDGSVTNPFGKLNAAFSAANSYKSLAGTKLKDALLNKFEGFLDAYYQILSSTRSDKLWIGCPKYTSLREIGEDLKWPESYDDRSLLTSVLDSGEFTQPKPYAQANYDWHIGVKGFNQSRTQILESKLKDIYTIIKQLHVLYYKPHSFSPAIRLEVPQSLTNNDYQIKMLLQAIEFQTRTPGLMEPYPLYMADRMVKGLSNAIPAFRQSVTNSMASTVEGDLSDVFFNMHSYRTENG